MKIIALFLLSIQTWASDVTTLKGLDMVSGQKIEINQQVFDGYKATVILFLSARCPCSNSHISEIKDLRKMYGQQIKFVAIHSNQNESVAEAQKYFKEIDLGFPVISDEDALIADSFKAFKTPHAFLLDAQGNVIYRGGVSSSQHFSPNVKKYLRDVLSDVVNGQKVRMSESKSLGCVILRKKDIE